MPPAPILPSRGLPSGHLAAEPNRLREIIRAARAAGPLAPSAYDRQSLSVSADGVATIPLVGLMVKDGPSWAGLSSTRTVRAQIRAAAVRDDVRAIVLHVSSPGGYVDGTGDLASDVADAAKMKPLEAFIEDIGASAAYWVASQARKVWANPTALIGSIGTYQVLWDESESFRLMGVRVHVLATGPLKGAGQPGTEITDEVLAAERTLVEDLNAHFLGAVRTGRRLTPPEVAAVATGEAWIASKAKGLGLIDGVKSADEVVDGILASAASRPRAAAARFRLEMAKNGGPALPRSRAAVATEQLQRALEDGGAAAAGAQGVPNP